MALVMSNEEAAEVLTMKGAIEALAKMDNGRNGSWNFAISANPVSASH